MKYRINYGQGQVGPDKASLAEARRELSTYSSDEHFQSFFIQALIDGEWLRIRVHKNGRRK